MKSRVLAVALLCCFFSTAHAYSLDRGSFSVGGGVRVPFKWDAFGHLTMGIDITPSMAYFAIDQLELVASLSFKGALYQNEFVQAPREPVHYGLQFGANYYFDFDIGFFPYIGVALGGEIADFKPISSLAYVEVPIGIAFIVRENLMIQFGAPVKVSLAPPGPTLGTAHVEWTPGFIGARVFL
jgi:hypothetical protein